jgi:hypothetical protein
MLLLLVVAASFGAAGRAASPTATGCRIGGSFGGPFGTGAAQVWVLRPNGKTRDVVVFGHGWKVAPPSAAYPWVRQFCPWIDHLLDGGSAVIFPRYQLGNGDPQDAGRVRDFASAVRVGYSRLGRPKLPFVAVGYSFGASLVFYYGANARRWHLPQPRAVDAVFTAGQIPGVTLPPLAKSVRVLIQVGDADTEAGRGGADQFWAWLRDHPASRKRYEIVRSTTGFTANHTAPKDSTPTARAAFWAPLDRLISLADSA